MRLRKLGLDVVVLVTEPFVGAARAQAETMGLPDLCLAVLPHPKPGVADETRAEHGRQVMDSVMAGMGAGELVPARREGRRP